MLRSTLFDTSGDFQECSPNAKPELKVCSNQAYPLEWYKAVVPTVSSRKTPSSNKTVSRQPLLPPSPNVSSCISRLS